MKTTLKIVQDLEKPVPLEILAESITTIAQGVKKLLEGPINERGLILLIQNSCPSGTITQKDVKIVLQGIVSLEKEYLKPKK